MATKKREIVTDNDTPEEPGDAEVREVGVQVNLEPEPEDGDEDELEEPEPRRPENEEQRESRNEKRRNRYRENVEKRIAAEERARLLEAQLAERSAAISAPQVDPRQAHVAALLDRQRDLWQRKESLTRDMEMSRQAGQLEARAGEFRTAAERLDIEEKALGWQIGQAINAPSPGEQLAAHFAPQYPRVFESRPAFAYARAVWERMTHEGHPDNVETIRASLEAAQNEFFGGSGRQSSMRSKSTGIRAGSGGSAGGSRVVWLSKDEKHIALARYPDVSPEEAYKRFAREIKPKIEQDGG